MTSKQHKVLKYAIKYQGKTYSATLWRRILSSDGISYYQPTNVQSIDIVGVLHTSANTSSEAVMYQAEGTITFETGIILENLFEKTENSFIILDDLSGLKVAINLQNAYNKKVDIYHYTGRVLPPIFETFIIPDGVIPPRISSNSMPIWLDRWSIVGDGTALYPEFSTSRNINTPHVVLEITQTVGTRMIAHTADKLDIWQTDDFTLAFIDLPMEQILKICNNILNLTINGDIMLINSHITDLTTVKNNLSEWGLANNIILYSNKCNYYLNSSTGLLNTIKEASVIFN